MSEQTVQQKLRGAYGRGYHDAVKAMEKDHMTPAKMAQAERSLGSIETKVLEAVPATEAWTVGMIVAELRRLGRNVDQAIVGGCINNRLIPAGLVCEPSKGTFRRIPTKAAPDAPVVSIVKAVKAAKPAADPEIAPPIVAPAPAASSQRDTLQKLANLSADVRTMAAAFTDLAAAIDDVALEVEDRIAAINADSEKLAQLRTLLKGIGG